MKTKNKKIILILIFSISVLLVLLIGLSLKEMNAESIPEKIKLQIAFYGNTNQQNSTEQLLELYQSRHPEVELEIKIYDPKAYDSYLTIALASGKMPDVFMINNTKFKELIHYNALADVSSQFSNNENNPMLDKALLPARQENNIYGLPVGISTNVFLLNTDIFVRMRQLPPTNIEWDSLIPISKEFKQSLDNRGFTLSFPINDFGIDMDNFLFFLSTKDCEFIDDKGRLGFTRENIYEYLLINAQYRKDNIIPPATDTAAEYRTDPANSRMVERAMAVDYVSLHDVPYYSDLSKDEFVYFLDYDRSIDEIRGTYISVYANSSNLEAAKSLAYFWYNDLTASETWMAPYGILVNSEVSSHIKPLMDDERKGLDDIAEEYLTTGNFSKDFIGRFSMELYFSKIYIDIAFGVIDLDEGTDYIYDKFKYLIGNQ